MSDDPALPKIELGGITVWDAREWFPTKTGGGAGAVVFYPRTVDQIKGVAAHHDAVAFSGLDLDFDGSTVDEERARMQASYNFHTIFYGGASVPGRGWNWPAMGYHLYTFPSQRIYLVGDILTIRAHVAYLNTPLIGIVGAGDFSLHRPQELHVVAYAEASAWAWLARGAELPLEGHRTWAEQTTWSSACPGDTYNVWIPDVRRIAKIEYARANEAEADPMIYKLANQWGPAMTFVVAWLPVDDGPPIPMWKRHVLTVASVERIAKTYGEPETFSSAELRGIPTIHND